MTCNCMARVLAKQLTQLSAKLTYLNKLIEICFEPIMSALGIYMYQYQVILSLIHITLNRSIQQSTLPETTERDISFSDCLTVAYMH